LSARLRRSRRQRRRVSAIIGERKRAGTVSHDDLDIEHKNAYFVFMSDIENIHDGFFTSVMSEAPNAKTFLKVALPAQVLNRLDFAEIAFDPTSYVSEEYKRSFSDLVVKCRTKAPLAELPVDIYILFEHKSYQDEGVLLQLLGYKHSMWKKAS
jgi:hypothetical protein